MGQFEHIPLLGKGGVDAPDNLLINTTPPQLRRGTRLLPFAGILITLTAAVFLTFSQSSFAPAYVDPMECAKCHAGISETFRRTGMGRSFYRPGPQNTVEDYKTKNTYYHPASNRYYTMIERDGRYFQRRHQSGPNGQPVNIVEKEVDYVIGSGNHARTYLHKNEQNKLVELPITWYSENGGYWAMSPGYDWRHQQDFRRKVTLECLFCHNAYPKTMNDSQRADSETVVTEKIPEGIDCQRCHGPGADHVRGVPNSIVNPAKLSRERNLEVCMQCHLESTSMPLPFAVRRFGRGIFSYRPGQSLADYMIHFDHAPGAGHDDKFEIAGSAYRLMKSLCFQNSGTLTCTTCHNPHFERDYIAMCQSCHESEHSRSGDCISCHMPKRRTEDVIHAVMTDHYIRRPKQTSDLLAPLAENHADAYRGEVVMYYPKTLPAADREMYSAVAQGRVRRLKEAIEKYRPASGEFYFELAKAYTENNSPKLAIPMYEQALARLPGYWPAVHRLGLAFSKAGRFDRAIQFLERASALSNEGTVLNDLALVYHRTGKRTEAISMLKKAVSIDPDLAHGWNNLAGMLWQSGDPSGAEQAFRKAIEAQPDLAAAHANLGGLLAERGNHDEGEYHYREALKLDPELIRKLRR